MIPPKASLKMTEDVKTHVPEFMLNDLQRLSSEAACNVGEAVRDILSLRLYGCTFGELVSNHRRAVLAAQGPTPDPLRPAI